MSRRRDRGWAPPPEPLPLPVVDNHTHLESVLEVPIPFPDFHEASAADHSRNLMESGVVRHAGGGVTAPNVEALTAHLAAAAAVGVTRMVQVGCDLESVAWTDEAVRAHPELLGAVAIHPNEGVLHAGVHEVAPDGLDPSPRPRHDVPLDEAIARVAAVARANPRIRAIGETGLDHFRAGPRGREVQREAFRAHIALAKELGLALQIHDRDAHADVLAVLEADGAPERTVFHCFSGDAELARTAAAHGWFCSFAGPVSYGANEDLRDALREVPRALLLAETDAPYLTAHPHRGRPNAPYLLPGTARAIAAATGRDLSDVCRGLSETAEQVYGPW